MKECDKRKSHISSKLHMIYISSNSVRHPVTKTFTSLHFTTLHSTSLKLSTLPFLSFKLHPTTLHYTSLHFTTLSFVLTPFKFPTASFHLTSLHFNSPHFTSLHFQMIFVTLLFHSFHPVYNISTKVLGFTSCKTAPHPQSTLRGIPSLTLTNICT